MDVRDSNRLLDVVGGLAGLGDDDEAYLRLRDVNVEDEDVLVGIIHELLLPEFVQLPEKRKQEGLLVLKNVAGEPREVQEGEWEAMLPAFDYPNTINFFALIHRTLTGA